MVEPKPKTSDSLRTPKAKKKLGLTVPPALRLPHDDLISAPVEVPPVETKPSTMTSQTSHSSQTSLTSHTSQPQEAAPVAPVRDFTKVANSIGREAVPAGLFAGKSKQLYDILYGLTRGAVVPARTVRISRPKLMKRAGIGARVTFDANIERLISVGLIQVQKITGEHEGNEYTVFLPEELSMPSQTSQTSTTSLTSHAQKLDRLVRLETSQTRHTSIVENTDTYTEPKTFIKTDERNDDDEAFAAHLALLKQAVRDVTGKAPSASEAERWREVAEVLVTELKIASGRTTVSSVPAFLAEHLRRRLWKKDKKQLADELSESPAESRPAADAGLCPDCRGTGLWYPAGNTPEGMTKGVARCRHEKLTAQEGEVKPKGD